MTKLQMAMYNPRMWQVAAVLLFILMVTARCDDYSTYPKG